MKNRISIVFTVVLLIILGGCKQKVKVHDSSFLAVNPLSYTDVIFKSDRDTVLVSTFSGRIAERIKGHNKENILINLTDEIYSLAYDQKAHRIYASTLNSGILIIDANTKTVTDSLSVNGSWISDVFLSKDGELLAGNSANRQNYIWDIKNNIPIQLPDSLSNYRVVGIDGPGDIILKGNGKFIFWNARENLIKKDRTCTGKLKSIDKLGNMLLFYDKDFQFFSASEDSISFKKHHQDWPYYLKEQDTIVRIPLQLALTVGQLTDQYIFTAGVDRSIRKWSNINGQLIEDIIEHKATISAIDLSPDQLQIVSVDLKGGILFYEINDKAVIKE
jgi:WD40 repeat protein